MDRYELTIKIEQLNKLVKKKDYESAAKIAEQLDWKKMKQWTVMSNAIEAFIAMGKYDKARNVCVYAYNRNLGGRRLLGTLMDMYLKLGEYEDAEEIYGEYVETAPRDLARYTLLYKLKRAQGAPVGELIDILQEYKEKELDEAYEYELALLYSEAGLADRCVRECDELVLWFADGEYVERALRLKQKYAPLTPRQAQNLAYLEQQSRKPAKERAPQPVKKPKTQERPLYEEAETVYEEPKAEEYPKYGKPRLVYQRPEQEYEQPQAMYGEVQPLYEEPQAMYREEQEQPVYEEPQPVYEEAEPLYEEPQAMYGEVQPLYEEPQAIYREEQEQLMYEEPQPQEEGGVTYIDDIGNTTEWTPIDVEIRPESDRAFGVEWNEPPKKKPEPQLPPQRQQAQPQSQPQSQRQRQPQAQPQAQQLQSQPQPRPKASAREQAGAELEEDYEITIKVPDYTVYDTRNVQQELKAHVQEIMEASRNMEQKQAILEKTSAEKGMEKSRAADKNAGRGAEKHAKPSQSNTRREQPVLSEPEDGIPLSVMDSTSEPTKEIIINKRQWRKASRNIKNVPTEQTTVLPKLNPESAPALDEPKNSEPKDSEAKFSLENLTVEQMAAIVAQMEAKKAEEENYQIEGQMDITQWLRELEEEAAATKEETEETSEAELEEILEVEEVPELEGILQEDISQEDGEIADLEEAINAGIEKIIDDTVNNAMTENKNQGGAVGYILQPEERRFLDKYLYMAGMERKLCKYIGSSRFIKPEGTLIQGNIVIMGSRFTDKTAFAVNLFKALHAFDVNREQKLAKISAQQLNNTGFDSVKGKLKGQTLIVEDAGRLGRDQISQMLRFMNSDAEGALFILEDEEFNINKIFAENPDFAAKFTGRFLLKQYTVNELVDIAKDYADEQGWRIEDKALLKLYLILSQLPNDDQGSVVSRVKEIMENAGENAKNRFGNKLFGRFRSVLVIRDMDLEVEGEKDEIETGYQEEYYSDSDGSDDAYDDDGEWDDDYYDDGE